MEALDIIIRHILQEFGHYVTSEGWRGRERAVSLYVLGFLISKCNSDGTLKHPDQVGMDVALIQQPGLGRKKLVCKDLVIWPGPAGYCWDKDGKPTRNPLAILEWKTRTEKCSTYHETWLKAFSPQLSDFIGYAVSLNPSGERTSITITRVAKGLATPGWLRFPGAL